jgi:signal transduction histidine kinase
MPIRLRLSLVGAGAALLALLVFGFLFDRLVVAGVPMDQDTHLSRVADRAVGAVLDAEPDELVSSGDTLASRTAGRAASGNDPFVAVIDDGGRVLAGPEGTAEVVAGLPASLLDEVERVGGARVTIDLAGVPELRLHLRRWQHPDGAAQGMVLAGQSTAFADQQLAGTRLFLGIAGVIALIAATIAAYVASGRALRPLRQAAATADEIGRTGDLSRRLPPDRSGDAVGQLSSSFNAMLGRLGDAQNQLSQTVEAQRRFLADASHELRTPLTSIRSNAAFLIQHPEADRRDRDEAMADIAAETERMTRLVDGLLGLARADAAPARPFQSVDLAATLDDVVQRFRRQGCPVVLRISGAPVVAGDGDALTQVAAILVDNATIHGQGEVEVDVWSSDHRVTLAVSDRGHGLDPADLGRVFERFYRSNGSAAADARADGQGERGAGLGLSIARSIVEAHGGSIRAANRDGGGAVFVVDLPHAR